MNEFDLIKQFFAKTKTDSSLILGIGDDAAIIKIPSSQQLVLCVDTLVAGVHFPIQTKAEDIAYKAVAVNFSDLAAMGATPKWITLALTLPKADPKWLRNFSKSLFEICNAYHVKLIGGDTTRGPLAVTIQAHGLIAAKKALKRSAAKVGDKIYVTKILGEAALGLQLHNKKINVPLKYKARLLTALNRPAPCVLQGILLTKFANACIDISDGFLADLQHVLNASKVGAIIDLEKIPLPNIPLDHQIKLTSALTGGDDYALCFTVPAKKITAFEAAFKKNKYDYFYVGEIVAGKKIRFKNAGDFKIDLKKLGYQHF